MANILDYIKWRGDLSFKQDKFNFVDNLILARFAYFPLDKLFLKDKKITIKEAHKRALKIGIKDTNYLQIDDKDLFLLMAESERFGNLEIADFVNKLDAKIEKQFSAVTIILPDNTLYISYRGTDNTLVGWKEDFNMSFSKFVPAQQDAVKYLEKVAQKTDFKLRVGGHSKGGNLAIYATVFSNDEVKKKIIKSYNNDGPGMSKEIIDMKEYREAIKKINTFVPQSSVVGRLLYHEEDYMVIRSTQTGVMQHDLYSWQVEGKEFEYLDNVNEASNMTDKVLKTWLSESDEKSREEFVDVLYQILLTTNAHTLHELSNNWLKTAGTCLKAYTDTSEENKKIISQTLNQLLKITKDNLKDTKLNLNLNLKTPIRRQRKIEESEEMA